MEWMVDGALPPHSHKGSSFSLSVSMASRSLCQPLFFFLLFLIYDDLLAITPGHGGLQLVGVRGVCSVKGGPAPCTLPPAIT